jgi:hypothetical protein
MEPVKPSSSRSAWVSVPTAAAPYGVRLAEPQARVGHEVRNVGEDVEGHAFAGVVLERHRLAVRERVDVRGRQLESGPNSVGHGGEARADDRAEQRRVERSGRAGLERGALDDDDVHRAVRVGDGGRAERGALRGRSRGQTGQQSIPRAHTDSRLSLPSFAPVPVSGTRKFPPGVRARLKEPPSRS